MEKSQELNNAKNEFTKMSAIKFIISSVIGILVFFIPISNGNTPLVLLISFAKKILGNTLIPIVVLFVCILAVTCLLEYTKKFPVLTKFYSRDGLSSKIMYVIGAILGVLIITKVGPEVLLNKNIGGLSLDLAGSVFVTVTVAGTLISLIAEFGLLQFIGAFIEPVMRPVYQLPGYAAVDGIASFVCAPSVGVFLTNKIYKDKLYTAKEAASIATNFSVCSLGFFLVLCEWGEIQHLYGKVVLTSLLITFIMAVIMIRIPPISNIPDEYIDGTKKISEKKKYSYKGVLHRAISSALETASTTKSNILLSSLISSFLFAIKIAGYILSVATIALFFAEATPMFTWIGKPFIPILSFLGLPDADIIAPSVLVCIAELGLPVLLIAGKNVAEASVFFITVLSTVQIVFFAESANAIMESDIPLGAFKLVIIFLERTVIAIPLVALAVYVLF